eukprot:scaffold2552_cov380-Prasinococcus_capsulatus_cf.AAC.30
MKEVSVVDGSQAGHENEDQENIALLATHSVTRIYKPPELQGRKGLGYTSTLREHNKVAYVPCESGCSRGTLDLQG